MQGEQRVFVKLCNLLDITYEGETAEDRARWVANVTGEVGTNAYGLADNGDDYTTAIFSTDEIEFVTVDTYNFMGSAYEQERFYATDWIVVREKATGDLYAYETEGIYEV
jgi:hypothetical protein